MAAPTAPAGRFLTAGWYHLVMANYAIDPDVLRPYVPAGTEIDFWNGATFVSVVGFQFLGTRVLGVPMPFHRDFEEVNLRFYVRAPAADGWRRGVVFLKEIVRRPLITFVARAVYHENYVTLPMRHAATRPTAADDGVVRYEWLRGGRWEGVSARFRGEPTPLVAGSDEEFITEHYWGYTRRRDGRTAEYAVEHPRWNVWPAHDVRLDADAAALYGQEFAPFLDAPPASAFVADGSPIVVRRGRLLAPR